MLRFRALAALVLLTLLVASPAAGRRGKLPPRPIHPDTLPSLIEAWSLPASLAPYVTNAHSPRMSLSGKLLYVFDHHGRRLVAVDVKRGKVAWHAPVRTRSDIAFSVTPLVARGAVFVASDGYVHCFNARSGKRNWEVKTKGVAVNGLARSKHRLFVPWIRVKGRRAQGGVHVWAIDIRRGRVEWSRKFPGNIGFVTGNSGGLYYVSDTGVLLGLTADRGAPRWQIRVKGRVSQPPLLKHGVLFVTTERRGGWTGLYAFDVKKGRLAWKAEVPKRLHWFLHQGKLVTVDKDGQLAFFDARGNRRAKLDLAFTDRPRTVLGASAGGRIYVFSRHADGNGFVRLVDPKKPRLLATANALDGDARSIAAQAKRLFIDGGDGDVHALRLDRSRRPKRRTVPPAEFARELLAKAAGARRRLPGVARMLAGLGARALSPVEGALTSDNPFVVEAAASAVATVRSRRSVPALLRALAHARKKPPARRAKVDPALALLDALATIRDGRAVKALRELLVDETQPHKRRRAAYVALGAVGSPAALAPIWSFRAAKALNTTTWRPLAHTPSFAHRVQRDVDPATPASDKIRRRTTRTIQVADGQYLTASLSPYLGGYNDIWIGPSDLSGRFSAPLFTGLTKPEVRPGRRIKLTRLKAKGRRATLSIQMRHRGKWINARPVSVDLRELAADRDGDGLPDIVERRLRLCVTHPDCDGDGIKDSEDVNPLASGKLKPSLEQRLFREAFFAYFAFLKRRGIVVVDPGSGPSFELYGRQDPVLSLRRSTIEKLRKKVGLHAIDFVSFGGPYRAAGSSKALKAVRLSKNKRRAEIGMDVVRSADNGVGFNVTLQRRGRKWVVTRMQQMWQDR